MTKKKRSAPKESPQKTSASKASSKRMSSKKKPPKKWARTIKTDSTHPPPGLFTQDAETVAQTMATKKVSPGGIGSAIRMVQMYINRSGKNLEASQKRELEKAKEILQARNAKAGAKTKKSSGAKAREKK